MVKQIDNREFVVTYMNSESLHEVAKALGMTPKAVTMKGTYLRKLGVKLPKFSRGATDRQLEVAQLNSIIHKELKRRGA